MKTVKKSNIIRILPFIFVILALMPIIYSCGGSSDNNGQPDGETVTDSNTSEIEYVETSALSTVASKDFGGYEFKIITQNMDNRYVDVMAETQNGATLNDLVYSRNMSVEEKFNVKISAQDSDYGSINNMIKRNVSAGDNPFDMYLSNATAYTLASDGYLMALNDVPYISLDKIWWDQNAITGMSIAGNIYMITGDITPTGLMTSECILFNKKLLENRNIEFPYQTALDGKWTLDYMNLLCAGLTEDLNGDGNIKASDDLFSFTCWFDAAHALFYGAGGVMVKKDADDIPSLTWDIDGYIRIYDKIYDLVITNQANYSLTDHEGSFKVFKESRAYFCDITFQKIELFLRDMQDDYGVLPMPKYDEAQTRYMTDVSGAGSMLVIPVGVQDIERTGMITEAMAAAAYDIITPSLYDVIVSTKNVRDKESAEIVQMIIRNRVFDMAHMYYIDTDDYVYNLLKAKSTDVASYFASREVSAQNKLDEIVQKFIENNK